MAKEHPRYAEMEFEDAGFQEYPKMVYPKGVDASVPAPMIGRLVPGQPAKPNQGVLVQNEEEEKLVLGGGVIHREADEVADLRLTAERLNIKVDNRWGPGKLQEKIDEAEAELNA